MSIVSEIIRLGEIQGIPDEVLDLILKQVYRWPLPKVNDQGYVVSKVKNIHKCCDDMVLENVIGRGRWKHIARLPALHAYERRVCIWSSEYYDLKFAKDLCHIVGISDWVHLRRPGFSLPLLPGIDRRSKEWIGYKSWIQTDPTFSKYNFIWERKNPKVLTDHWFKYELALAYPTLYGKKGWANK